MSDAPIVSDGYQHSQQPQYNDGLEVVPNPTDPEWVASAPGNETHNMPLQDGKMLAKHEKVHVEDGIARPWRKKKSILLIIAAIVIAVAVGLGAGLGAGLSSNQNDNSGNNEKDSDENQDSGKNSSSKPPSCNDSICPRLLSTTIHKSSLYVFARTSERRIAYRTYNGSTWSDDWHDLGETVGNLVSQPTAMSWTVRDETDGMEEITRLEVTVVGSSGRTVYGRYYSDYDGWAPEDDDWIKRGATAGSPVVLCKGKKNRLDMWVTDAVSRNITHIWWEQRPNISEEGKSGKTGDIGFWTQSDQWDAVEELGTQAKSTPAIVCRDSDVYHDVLWYDNDEDFLRHSSHGDDTHWSEPRSFEGEFIGDPTVFTFPDDKEQWDFFGVQEDRKLYHLRWNAEPGSTGRYSGLNSLDGSILSVPSVVSLDSNTRDVVVLGTDGKLYHRHYDGSGWSANWEDLGIWAHSAPSVAVMEEEERVFILAVKEDGGLMAWSRDMSVNESWKDALNDGEELGGNLHLGYLTENS